MRYENPEIQTAYPSKYLIGMTTITIKNVGPIKNIEKLQIKKVNVFMGQQSSGKSTIAKIISYCSWIEKEVAINQSLGEYNMNGNFRKKLEDFHRLYGYINGNTEIYYKSEVIDLQFKNNECSIEWVDKYAYRRNKIAYIPSERNLASLPFIQTVAMPDNNNRSFLFDWLTIRSKYRNDNKVEILDLPVAYYYKESMGAGENHIFSTEKNNQYDILLENASSGLQSVTPLIVASKYLAEWIYEHREDVSFEKEQKLDKVGLILNQELVVEPLLGKQSSNEEFMDSSYRKIRELLKKQDAKALTLTEKWNEVMKHLFRAFRTQFIIEEPELNLFPSTQRSLIYYLLELINGERDHQLIITTHSPYILYALNNCMFGYLVNSQLQGAEKDDYLTNHFLSEKSWINPQSVSVWEIEDGTLRNIQDKDQIISENYFDKKMTELTDEYYLMLNYYTDEE